MATYCKIVLKNYFPGETSVGIRREQDQRMQESTFPSRKPSRSSSMRPTSDVVESKADSWEKAQLRKINKR